MAVYNNAVLTIVNSVFADNTIGGGGSALGNDDGGIATIIDSTFINNTAIDGGAITNYGIMQIQQSAFWHNSASSSSG